MSRELKEELSEAISEATARAFTVATLEPKSGGCINDAYIASDGAGSYFVKLNAADALPMFEAEAAALKELAAAEAVRVPRPVSCGLSAGRSYLVLEALDFGSPESGSWERMGQQLARLHRTTREQFGWHGDNTIGATPQRNDWTSDWPTFFLEQRLGPQFEMARHNGHRFDRAETLMASVAELLDGHAPEASLLHGDLWSGNASFLEGGTPVIFDPATYYGDRETDLAFSEFFGGFPGEFYAAYENEWPLPPGYERRKVLYNLYHVLNHANLFGGGYAGQAEDMISQLLN
ncbi:MAG TPA: fructosamine kinase family protein [Opitutales bacterium]|nr:fructosamine kinase family protein [Opitutales bacterium]